LPTKEFIPDRVGISHRAEGFRNGYQSRNTTLETSANLETLRGVVNERMADIQLSGKFMSG